jgi:hypothetical protein
MYVHYFNNAEFPKSVCKVTTIFSIICKLLMIIGALGLFLSYYCPCNPREKSLEYGNSHVCPGKLDWCGGKHETNNHA